jgi:hypothetical protein
MAETLFTRDSSFIPGAGDVQHFYYAEHSSGLCRFMLWRPSATFTDAPVLVYIHGGLGHKPGYRGMDPNTGGPTVIQLCQQMSALGWVVVSIDYPAVSTNQDSVSGANDSFYGEWPPVVDIFEQTYWQGRAIAFLRDNYSGVGSTTLHGAAMLGSGNSIDPDNIHLIGVSAGGTTSLLLGLTPDGTFNFGAGNPPLTMDRYVPRSSHRPNSVIVEGCQIDWTQFHIIPGTGSALGTIYENDIHQMFMRKQSGYVWSTIPLSRKQAGSPYWHLLREHPQNMAFPVLAFWAHSSSSDGANLTQYDWSPGTVLSNIAGGKAYTDPHHHFVGQPWANAIQGRLDDRSATYWGNSTENPATPVPDSTATVAKNWLLTVLS